VKATAAPPTKATTSRQLRHGVISAVAQLGAGELVAALLPRARSPLDGLGQTMIDLLPGPSVDVVVAIAETKDKAMLRAVLAASALGFGGFAARLEAQGRRRGHALLVSEGLLAGAAAASRPENSATRSLLAGLGGAAAGAATLASLGQTSSRVPEGRLLGAGLLSLGIAGVLRHRQRVGADRRREEMELPAATQRAHPIPSNSELRVPGITPLFTPNAAFYVTDTVLTAPRVDAGGWQLRVHGMVERELELSLQQLLTMELVEVDATLVCVHNPVGGYRVGSARWLGVPLSVLLSVAGVRAECDQVLAHAVNGFSGGVPLDMIGKGPIPLVALGMNGAPLTVRNGFPARLLTPGIWGADASTKWLRAVELTTWERASDYWDARGWPRTPGKVKPGARIDVPADHSAMVAGWAVAAGVAWAPRAGVTGVEVAIDDGPWQPARLSPEIAPTLWRQWALPWRAEPGGHQLRVRTLSGEDIQEERLAPPYPHGSSGYHTVHIQVPDGGALPPLWHQRLRQLRADLDGRVRLAGMAPTAWRKYGFPRRPSFADPLPPARRGVRELLPSRTR
jgi:DMSO/TMAO reductase YedYZ molybdopterin-dependent catalytic subunit